MKTLKMGRWGLTLGLLSLLFGTGCAQQALSSQDQTNSPASNTLAATSAISEGAAKDTAATEPGTNSVPAEAEIPITEADYVPVTTEKPVPPNVRTGGPLGEVIKMTESGVEETVLLAFVTNSASIFSLDADEIIYLKDIGLPPAVVTAMIQHDLELKGTGAGTTSIWTAPQTAETDPTNNTPAPEEIAPQSTEAPPPPANGQTAQVAAAPESQVTYNTFYSSLSPYGNWVYIEGYGNVWQPSVVVANPTWTPYLDNGRWVYSDYGWYWLSDYSWGWAPFHYGRWFRHYRLGWCWYPDYVWGPSWVTWRYTGSYCGWAPLPPGAWWRSGVGLTWWGGHVGVGFSFGLGYNCYSFVPWNHFHHDRLHHHKVYHHDQWRRVYHDSVVSTRIHGNRSRVVNDGLVAEQVSKATGIPVQRVRVRDTTQVARGVRRERLERDGNTISVYRPKLPESASRTMPERVARASGGSSKPIATTTVNESRSLPASRLVGRTTPTRTEPTTVAGGRAWERPTPATSREPRVSQTTRINRERPTLPSSIDRQPETPGTVATPTPTRTETSTRLSGREMPYTVQRRSAFATAPSSRTPTAPTTGPADSTRTPELTSPAQRSQPTQAQSSPATRAWQSRQTQRLAPQVNSRPTPSVASPPAAQAQAQTRTPAQSSWSRGTIAARQDPTAPAQIAPQANPRPSTPTYPSLNRSSGQVQRQFSTPSVQSIPRSSSQFSMPARQAPSYPSFQAPSRVPSDPQAAPAPRSFSSPSPSRSFSPPAPSPAPSRSFSTPTPSRSFSAPAQSSSSSTRSGSSDSSGFSRPSRER